ncbi:MAG: zinc ribbon domain-containing protein [Deltaproteobacteria bacterium]|nr:zinc ribbon domain-containing protein [Deltaproteobacteria bacterium]
MTDQIEQKTAKVPLKSFLADLRSPLTDAELIQKYDLSARSFLSLIKALLTQNLITAQDLAWRKEMAVQRDLAKESEFLAGLYICPHCSHPHPKPFAICPACGGDTGDSFAEQELLSSILSSSGNHVLNREEARPDVAETQLLDSSELPVPGREPPRAEEEDLEDLKTKPSTLDSFRSIISKLKKK